jgi:hypothetical protein
VYNTFVVAGPCSAWRVVSLLILHAWGVSSAPPPFDYKPCFLLMTDNRPWTCVLEEQYYHPRVLK